MKEFISCDECGICISRDHLETLRYMRGKAGSSEELLCPVCSNDLYLDDSN